MNHQLHVHQDSIILRLYLNLERIRNGIYIRVFIHMTLLRKHRIFDIRISKCPFKFIHFYNAFFRKQYEYQFCSYF